MGRDYRTYSKTYKTPNRPFEKERLDRELRLIGKYGLRNKKEIWRVNLALAKVRKTARELLTLAEDDPVRVLEGTALLRRLKRLGILSDDKDKLDYVLGLKVEDFLERRLQTILKKKGLAKSVHQARVYIHGRHIAVGKQIVNAPSYMVRVDSEAHIQMAPSSALVNKKKLGRVKKIRQRNN
mmetsp:Transcript_12316/g.18391  ORF Transcript_12316/g.18391 Transcript_12316/m.18391 type:complete len:182 (-) Transcript_12316:79-624(-)